MRTRRKQAKNVARGGNTLGTEDEEYDMRGKKETRGRKKGGRRHDGREVDRR